MTTPVARRYTVQSPLPPPRFHLLYNVICIQNSPFLKKSPKTNARSKQIFITITHFDDYLHFIPIPDSAFFISRFIDLLTKRPAHVSYPQITSPA